MSTGLLIIDQSLDDSHGTHGNGAWNMSVDQGLHDWVAQSGRPVLRIYRWSEPTLSLGYFQKYSDRRFHQASLGLPVVRRSTGGGAIVHDREWTYSLCLPVVDRVSGKAMRFYRDVHQAIIEVMAGFGARLARHADLPRVAGAADDPFLCFQRRTDDDLICAGYKVVGSAQRRSAGVLLQHGSILLDVSAGAPELPGIGNLTLASCDFQHFCEVFARMLSAKLEVDRFEQRPLPVDIATIRRICCERFEAQNWTQRRN